MLVSLVMICSCQKQDSAAEQQLAQRKTELDAREEALADRKSALDERQKALDEREKSLAQKEKATMNARTNPTDVQDPAQVQAETDMLKQQLSAMKPGPAQLNAARAAKAEKEREIREQLAQTQPRLEELQRERQRKMEAKGMSGGAVFPSAAATSPTPSPAVEAISPSSSPTPE